MPGLYTMGGDIAARIPAQGGAASGWHPIDSVGQALTCGIAASLVLLGMAVDGVLVLLARVEFLPGAAVAPPLLPGLAFGLTSQLWWGPIHGLVRGAVRVIATGAAVGIMARACAAVVAVPGTDQVLSWAQMAQLMTLAVGTAMVGFVAYRLAGQVVGSPGVLGMGSVAGVGSAAAVGVGGAAAAGRMAGAAVGMAAGAPAALAGMAGRFGGGGGGAGSVGTASAGSPFSSQASGGAGAASSPSGLAGSSGPVGQSGPVGRSGPAGSAFSAGSRP